MFESLSDKLTTALRSLRGQGVLTEAQVDSALRQVRLALLEADVHFRVVKEFVARVRDKTRGEEILRSLTPDQAVLRVVRDEMVALLGGETAKLVRSPRSPSVVLLAGLQGSGKTTTSAKLGAWLVRSGHHPLLVSTDVQRPAAREQLAVLGRQAELKVLRPDSDSPVGILGAALAEARAVGHDFVLVDTAGRLHVDDASMDELAELRRASEAPEVLFVADAMTGQDAVRSAEAFHARAGITGIVLTKLDGDSRGGAALSAAAVTGCPVKFAGTGEKTGDLEPFDPHRMVSRILGMGDVMGLIERAEEAFDAAQAEQLARKLRRSEFTLQDYAEQLRQLKKLGPLDQVLSMLPGAGQLRGVDTSGGEREMARALAIIDSMTPRERREPSVINGSRRKRIAGGSGTRVEDVNRVLKQFAQARKLMKSMGGGRGRKRLASLMPGLH